MSTVRSLFRSPRTPAVTGTSGMKKTPLMIFLYLCNHSASGATFKARSSDVLTETFRKVQCIVHNSTRPLCPGIPNSEVRPLVVTRKVTRKAEIVENSVRSCGQAGQVPIVGAFEGEAPAVQGIPAQQMLLDAERNVSFSTTKTEWSN